MTRDFTIDRLAGKFVLLAHTKAARELVSELALANEVIEGYVIGNDDVVALAHRLRKEGFRVNS